MRCEIKRGQAIFWGEYNELQKVAKEFINIKNVENPSELEEIIYSEQKDNGKLIIINKDETLYLRKDYLFYEDNKAYETADNKELVETVKRIEILYSLKN